MTDMDLLRENGRLRKRVQELERDRAEAVAGLMAIASLTQSMNLLWWQNKARETLRLMGAAISEGKE